MGTGEGDRDQQGGGDVHVLHLGGGGGGSVRGGGGGIMVRWKGVIVVPQDSLLAAVSTSDV